MLVAGLDIGSTATKVVLYDGQQFHRLLTPTGWSPRRAAEQAYGELLRRCGLSAEQVGRVVATGYGRIAITGADRTVTEITCHARGAAYLDPQTEMVVDIGGQDSKVIKVDTGGGVVDFAMNDKCAAGTGRFLEVIAASMGVEVDEMASLAKDCRPVPLNSMCTVFAESEVLGLLSQGKGRGEIIAGLHLAITRRIVSMVERLGHPRRVTLTGGVARNEGVRRALERQLGSPVVVPDDCQYAGAIGAALIGCGG